MLPSQKSSGRRQRQKRFSNYVPQDFDQRVPFLVRKVEEEEPEEPQESQEPPLDDEKRDSLSEAVKIHWTWKGESEEEWIPPIEFEDEDLLDPAQERKKISDSTVEEAVSLLSYVPEPEPEPEPVIIEEPLPKEEKPKKKKDRKKKSESIKSLEETMETPEVEPVEEAAVEMEPETKSEVDSLGDILAKVELEYEADYEADYEVASKKSESIEKLEEEVEPEWTAKSETETAVTETEVIEAEVIETAVVSEWEPKSAPELDQDSVFSEEPEEMVVETEEIKLQMVDPPEGEESEDETPPSYTWLLGPTSDEVILEAVEFFTHVASFVKDPIRFGHRRECCKKKKPSPTGSGDDCENEAL